MFQGLFPRIAAAILALAAAAPALAGDVDERFDRTRSRPVPARNSSPASAPVTRMVVARGSASEVAIRKDEPVTLLVTPKGNGACTVEIKAR